MNIIEELSWRGLLKQATNEEKILTAQLNKKAVYCGFDPTASSLHVGHLMQIISLERFAKAGLKPIAIIGGGTGMIGDPSFKSSERVLQTAQQVDQNVACLEAQLRNLIPNVKFVNNAEWLSKLSLIDFLRDIGKDFNLSYLLAKESIATRISSGLSITEFMYTLLQGYDFYELYTNYDCSLQIGGSDQWGNITSGTDYISSRVGKANSQAAGLTIQLLTKKDGQKFGKTESGAVWLDAKKTNEYEFYQFWLNQDDQDCEKMLKFLTFLSQEEIITLQQQHQVAPFKHVMQKEIAKIMTLYVHGQSGLDKALKLTEAFFQGSLSELDSSLLELVINSMNITKVTKETTVIDAIITTKAASSKREAREFLASKAISFNGIIISGEDGLISQFKLLLDKYLLIKKGKRNYFVLEVN